MGEVARYVFVKGDCILVYGQETDPSPLYAIALENFRAIQENPKKPDRYSFTVSPRANTNEARVNLVTILLKYKDSGKQAYQLTFDTTADRSIAKRFMDVMVSNTSEKKARGEVLTAMTKKDLD
jgi:hypothetical protein